MGKEVAPAARGTRMDRLFDAGNGREEEVITAHGKWAGEYAVVSIDAV